MIFITLGRTRGKSRLRQSEAKKAFRCKILWIRRSLGWRCETGSHCSIEHIKIRDYMRLPGSSGGRCCYRRKEKIEAGMRMPRMEACDPPGSAVRRRRDHSQQRGSDLLSP